MMKVKGRYTVVISDTHVHVKCASKLPRKLKKTIKQGLLRMYAKLNLGVKMVVGKDDSPRAFPIYVGRQNLHGTHVEFSFPMRKGVEWFQDVLVKTAPSITTIDVGSNKYKGGVA